VIVRRLLVLAGPPVHAQFLSFFPCLCTFLSSLQSPPCFPSISVELESKRQPTKQRTTLRDSVVIVVFVVVFLLLIC